MKLKKQINNPNSCQPPVTDNGEAVESRSALPRVISYIPYGEIFVEQQSGGWQSPYLFNSKELDSETGLYYYGARYLDPSSAAWLSVDPLWEKYVDASPYNYCHGNPIMLFDSDGKEETKFHFRIALTAGGQIGFNFADFFNFELNAGSVDLISFETRESASNGEQSVMRHIGESQPRVNQKASVGAGLPVVGEINLGVEKTTNDPMVESSTHGGCDIDVAKVSFAAKLIIGFEIEANWNFTEENTFVKGWNMLKDAIRIHSDDAIK